MFLEETFLGRAIALANFPQHPADGLVNQIMVVAKQDLGDCQRIVELTLANVVIGRDDRDAPFPE